MSMRRRLKLLLLVPLLAVGALVLTAAMRTPSLDRAWDDDVRVLASVDIAGDGVVRLGNVRDWSYAVDTILTREYFDGAYDPADLVDAWMYEQILDGDRGLIAHTFIVFEFDSTYGDRRWLGLSVETRRERGETYSLAGGMLRSFEVTHIWATERDLVTRRVQYLDYPLTRYRLVLTPEQRARIFTRFAEETRDLASRPQWYNTVARNCTSSLIQYVNEGRPGALPRHWSWVFTGRVDDYLGRLGYLDSSYRRPITRDWLASHPLR